MVGLRLETSEKSNGVRMGRGINAKGQEFAKTTARRAATEELKQLKDTNGHEFNRGS